MWSSPRDSAIYRADDARKQFDARSIKLPKAVTAALETLDRIRATMPKQPAADALRGLILSGADEATVERALLTELGHSRLSQEWHQAEIDAAGRVLRELKNAHDGLYGQLRERADRQIAHVEHVAGLDGARLEDLVREGRHADAERLATIDVAGTELHALFELYANYIAPHGYPGMLIDGWDATRYVDPRPAMRHDRGNHTVSEGFVWAVRNGAQLHFPDHDSARTAAEPLAAEARADADRLAAVRAGQGHVGAFMPG